MEFTQPSSSRMSLATPITLDVPTDFLPPQDLQPHASSADQDIIAPWLSDGPSVGAEAQPPTPPPKSRFPYKSSFSFGSTSTLGRTKTSESSLLRPRPSDASSLFARASDNISLETNQTVSSYGEPSRSHYGTDMRKKSSSSFLSAVIRRARSSSRLAPSRLDLSAAADHPVPPLPSPDTIGPSQPPSPPPTHKSGRGRGKKKTTELPPSVPLKDTGHEFRLDRDIDNMDGIIDLTIASDITTGLHSGDPSSPSSGFETSTHSSSDVSSTHQFYYYSPLASSSPPGGSTTVFNDPFQTPTGNLKRKWGLQLPNLDRKISPKTRPPYTNALPPAGQEASWTAPESWAVDQGDDPGDLLDYSDSELEDLNGPKSPNGGPKRKRNRRTTMSVDGKGAFRSSVDFQDRRYKIRIYRANNTYHLAQLSLGDTVQQMIPHLNEKVLFDKDRETHRLYLKERGRERMLGMTEKPASIVRRQLQQAGYEDVDDLQEQEDIQFLMKFVYKSNVLGGNTDDDVHFEDYGMIDLAARALRTIPVVCHQHADEIISLNMSRNPMVEIPLDFIQGCTNIKELRLQNMAMKKVPQSVRHAITLHRLDLSCNRITNLDDAALDHIPLRSLKLQNNGMEKLPWYFPRLRSLRELNISNNKFRQVPDVVCKIPSLMDLDISFNMISELPVEIGNLELLERLIIVGNQVSRFPPVCSLWTNLKTLDCRRNNISDLTLVSTLPKVESILADHNVIHLLNLSFGPSLLTLDASHNDITLLTAPPDNLHRFFSMTELNISHAKLSSLDNLALGQLTSLKILRVDHNSIRSLPDSVGELGYLRELSCSNNQLYALPDSLGRLQRLETLEAHNNSIEELPSSVWDCASLCVINLTSNLLKTINEPALREDAMSALMTTSISSSSSFLNGIYMERKASAASSVGNRTSPPLAYSLEKMFLGENLLSEEHLHHLMVLKELKVLNLSFNRIQLIPPAFLRTLSHLEELYLSGNELTALPNAELESLTNLRVLFLNGNKLQSLPQELGKIKTLTVLDVGSNLLRYNINNWEFDWNWNFNHNLRYLNLSGNKRLEIKPDHKAGSAHSKLDDFSALKDLKVLGLMDVTTTFAPNIPDDTEDRRVRTSLSEVHNMAYGIADTLGKSLTMFDFVQPEFRDRKDEAIFGMFGRASHIGSNHRISKYLQDHVTTILAEEVDKIERNRNGAIRDAMRRTFLRLNKGLHDFLYARDTRRPSAVSASGNMASAVDFTSFKSGACGVVLYFTGKTLYVAHAGSALAVISRQGNAEVLTKLHDPFDREETTRIRFAEGWVSPKGLVNDEVDVSRSFGYYYLLPVICARPDIVKWELNALDEFVIIGNRGLWDYVSYQTAVDIARKVHDPMIAAQKLRDFAMSYGAEGTTMIMVISVSDLFDNGRSRQHTLDPLVDDAYLNWIRNRKDDISAREIHRLGVEAPAPQGHIALVFTDIRNSTHLWEANRGMQTAISSHNSLLRRHLRLCGGYEVKTEGDAFMCAFPTTLAAVWWSLVVQVQLLQVAWPLEILECEDGKEIYDDKGKLVARGLSVRMGIHCGRPIPDPDPTTRRMDYLGPVVNRAARISGSAAGGQIMCSADVMREINASIYGSESTTEYSHLQSPQAIEAIRRLGVEIIPVGEFKLKGLEAPESLSLLYPAELAGRHGLENLQTESASGSRVQFSVEQMRELAMLCIRLETLASSRVFRPLPVRKGSTAKTEDEELLDSNPIYLYGNPDVLLPNISNASDAELTLLLDSLSLRIENALSSLTLKQIQALNRSDRGDVVSRRSGATFDVRILQQLLSLLPTF